MCGEMKIVRGMAMMMAMKKVMEKSFQVLVDVTQWKGEREKENQRNERDFHVNG